jgi:hypothetical protein
MNDKKIWTAQERRLLDRLNTPWEIQKFLNRTPYNPESECRSPRYVIQNKRANCSEGAIFAAAALQYHGYLPFIMDLQAQKGKDDDHVIAVFPKNCLLGSIAKSNFTVLRFRDAIYSNPKEVALAYFDFYFNREGEKTLHKYSTLMDIEDKFSETNWQTSRDEVDFITEELDRTPHFSLISALIKRNLSPVDPDLLEAGLLGSNPAGLYKPKKKN